MHADLSKIDPSRRQTSGVQRALGARRTTTTSESPRESTRLAGKVIAAVAAASGVSGATIRRDSAPMSARPAKCAAARLCAEHGLDRPIIVREIGLSGREVDDALDRPGSTGAQDRIMQAVRREGIG